MPHPPIVSLFDLAEDELLLCLVHASTGPGAHSTALRLACVCKRLRMLVHARLWHELCHLPAFRAVSESHQCKHDWTASQTTSKSEAPTDEWHKIRSAFFDYPGCVSVTNHDWSWQHLHRALTVPLKAHTRSWKTWRSMLKHGEEAKPQPIMLFPQGPPPKLALGFSHWRAASHLLSEREPQEPNEMAYLLDAEMLCESPADDDAFRAAIAASAHLSPKAHLTGAGRELHVIAREGSSSRCLLVGVMPPLSPYMFSRAKEHDEIRGDCLFCARSLKPHSQGRASSRLGKTKNENKNENKMMSMPCWFKRYVMLPRSGAQVNWPTDDSDHPNIRKMLAALSILQGWDAPPAGAASDSSRLAATQVCAELLQAEVCIQGHVVLMYAGQFAPPVRMRVVDAESEEEAAGSEGEGGEGGEGGVPSREGSHFGDDEYIEWPEIGYVVTATAVGVSDAGGSDEEDSNQSDDLMPGSDIEDEDVLRDLWGNESEDSEMVYVDESDTDSDDSEISSGSEISSEDESESDDSEISSEDESESDDSEISNEDGALLGGQADIDEEHITMTFMVHEPEELRKSRIRRRTRLHSSKEKNRAAADQFQKIASFSY